MLNFSTDDTLSIFSYYSFVMRILTCIVAFITMVFCTGSSSSPANHRAFPLSSQLIQIKPLKTLRLERLDELAHVINESITAGAYPGAVLMVGHKGQLIYQGVFGSQQVLPDYVPMKKETIFDLASLTKVIATTPAIMQLVERGQINLDAPVSVYWPAFNKNGKQHITVRHLLTHTSGLPPDVTVTKAMTSQQAVLDVIAGLKVKNEPGVRFQYSDVNFIILGYLVERLSGLALDEYAQNHIFKPLRMNDTHFKPDLSQQWRIAPTLKEHDVLYWGRVQDPIAAAMGGVSGHAGLFSTANDVAVFAQAMLNGGRLPSPYLTASQRYVRYFLGPLTIRKMTTPQTPSYTGAIRGLGWDMESPYSNRGVLFPVFSFGHTGWTGGSIWIDPSTETWIVFLTSRLHPTPSRDNRVIEDRKKIATIVAASLVDVPVLGAINTGYSEEKKAFKKILTGAEQVNQYLPLLKNKRVAVVVNQTSVIDGQPLVDVLIKHGVNITTIFTPEHGYNGVAADGQLIKNSIDKHHIPIISLYGSHHKPTKDDLKNTDVIVFDLQDVGVRFYTYTSTLQRVMEAATEENKAMILLDRPNPNGFYVDGPVLDASKKSFTGLQPVPVVHGMTMGEYASMLVGESWLDLRSTYSSKQLKLTVIPALNYTHNRLYVPPIPPSPNLPSIQSIYMYPSIGLMEGLPISVGRGTKIPFQIFGHPGFKTSTSFKPKSMVGAENPPFKNNVCYGWDVSGTSEHVLSLVDRRLQITYLMQVLHALENTKSLKDMTVPNKNKAPHSLFDQIRAGWTETDIRKSWEPKLTQFKQIRKKYLLYPDFDV